MFWQNKVPDQNEFLWFHAEPSQSNYIRRGSIEVVEIGPGGCVWLLLNSRITVSLNKSYTIDGVLQQIRGE